MSEKRYTAATYSSKHRGILVEFKAKESKNLLFPLIEMFTQMRRQQAADAFI